MKKDRYIELNNSVTMADNARERLRHTSGVRGLTLEQAKELGVFNRIGLALCAFHAATTAGYRFFGDVEYILSELGANKHEIAKACKDYQKAFDKFYHFWEGYYKVETKEVYDDVESLYQNILRWMQIPEFWHVGDPQRTESPMTAGIEIDDDGDFLTFHQTTTNVETKESKEMWCVTKYDKVNNQQVCVEQDMDKASALMVAKRLSKDDTSAIYTASQVQDVVLEESIITPFRAFRNGNNLAHKERKYFPPKA